MSRLYLGTRASRARHKEAAAAQANRREIVKALSWGQVSRRDLLRYGIFTGAGLLAPIPALTPFITSAVATSSSNIPTGLPSSPMFGVKAFTQPLLRFDVLPRRPIDSLSPLPTAEANQTQHACDPLLGGGQGPIEGRPPGPMWAHQGFYRFPPSIAVEVTQEGANTNDRYQPGCTAEHNSRVPAGATCRPCFHPSLPDQAAQTLWTFNGTIPPKLLLGRYGEGILFRHHNRLPFDMRQNAGFGRHTI